MLGIAGAYVEIEGERPEELAGFYERLFGLSRESATADSVVLTGGGVRIRIRRAVAIGTRDDGPVFGFLLASGSSADAARDEAVAAGAIVLSESKRDGAHSLVCQDPAGNDFALVAGVVEPVVALARQGAPPETSSPVNAPPTPIPVAPTRGAPTRRDWDRLRDEERLASMKESIAGLDMPFGTADPATVLDEMRAKIKVPHAPSPVEEADAAIHAREREQAVDEALRRYRDQLTAPDPEPAPRRPEESHESAEPERPRTLGRSARTDEEDAG